MSFAWRCALSQKPSFLIRMFWDCMTPKSDRQQAGAIGTADGNLVKARG